MDENRGSAANILNIPTAIVIAGAIVAGAIIFTARPAQKVVKDVSPQVESLESIKPVTSADHILGNPSAKIKIVEYSDPSCPFCKMFNNTMEKIMDDYGKTGDVAWVYRHFPIDKPGTRPDGGILHKNAGHEAQALECAGSLGGNDKFWAYTKRLYEITPSVTPDTPDGLDQNELPKIAKFVGLNVADFESCLASGKFKDKVESEYLDGLNIGVEGTPTSVIITQDDKKILVNGAQDYTSLKQVIDALLTPASAQAGTQAGTTN